MVAARRAFYDLGKEREVIGTAAPMVLAFLVLVGPLAWLCGVDSRRPEDPGWVAGPRG
jgi:hypothetical protein